MFDFLSGTLVEKKPTEVVIDVNGVGYSLKVSLSTFKQLPEQNSKITLKSYLHVREDMLQLFGFTDNDERQVFLGLMSVSGVGPKLAQTILSGLSANELINAVQNSDEGVLSSISGVGKKTAQRLVVELKDKFARLQATGAVPGMDEKMIRFNGVEQEALMALISLGYNRLSAEKAIRTTQQSDKITIVEELLKKALQVI